MACYELTYPHVKVGTPYAPGDFFTGATVLFRILKATDINSDQKILCGIIGGSSVTFTWTEIAEMLCQSVEEIQELFDDLVNKGYMKCII